MSRKCQICGCDLTTEYKYCKECRIEKKRQYAKKLYAEQKAAGIVRKRYGITICPICGEQLVKNRPDQIYHGKCKPIHKGVEDYNKIARDNEGRTKGRRTILDLGFKLQKNIVIHHIDENPTNNNISNLMILNRKEHSQLHRLLEKNWSLLLKDNSSNLENCWNTLRGQLTTAWLETKGANVIKITDIGQSAAEPLNENKIYLFENAEGSETMH